MDPQVCPRKSQKSSSVDVLLGFLRGRMVSNFVRDDSKTPLTKV